MIFLPAVANIPALYLTYFLLFSMLEEYDIMLNQYIILDVIDV